MATGQGLEAQGLESRRDSRPSATTFGRNLVTGGAVAAASKTAHSPLEVIKFTRRFDGARYPGSAWQVLVQLPRREGISALWRGNTINTLRYLPTPALNFAFNDVFKVRA